MKYQLSFDPSDRGKIAIPDLPRESGVYIVHFLDDSQYIGEAVELRKRWIAYRNAITPEEGEKRRANGDTRQQWTNIRLNALILGELQNSRDVFVETIFTVDLDGEHLDLNDKHQRKTAEGIVLTRAKRLGVEVRND